MALWQLSYSQAAGGFFFQRERSGYNGKSAYTEHGDVFYTQIEDAKRSLTIRNDGVIQGKERRRLEAKAAHD